MPFSRGSSWPRDRASISSVSWFFSISASWEAHISLRAGYSSFLWRVPAAQQVPSSLPSFEHFQCFSHLLKVKQIQGNSSCWPESADIETKPMQKEDNLLPVSQKTSIQHFLFIITRTWKLPRWPSADNWIRKLWYIYSMEYFSAVKIIHLNQF